MQKKIWLIAIIITVVLIVLLILSSTVKAQQPKPLKQRYYTYKQLVRKGYKTKPFTGWAYVYVVNDSVQAVQYRTIYKDHEISH